MLIRPASTRECERLFRRELERRGHRFDRYKKNHWQRPKAALSVVQVQNAVATAATAVTVTIATSANNLVVIWCGQNVNNTSTLTVTDSTGGSNTWVQKGGYSNGIAGMNGGMFYTLSGIAVSSITATWSGGLSGRINIVVYEISGADMTTQSENAATQGTSANTTLTSNPLTTSNANDILLHGMIYTAAITEGSPPTNFSFPANSQGTRISVSNQIVSATQSNLQVTQTWTTSANAVDILTAFRAGTGGGGGPSPVTSIDFTPGAGQVAVPQGNAVAW
jgi:hypothetical protein